MGILVAYALICLIIVQFCAIAARRIPSVWWRRSAICLVAGLLAPTIDSVGGPGVHGLLPLPAFLSIPRTIIACFTPSEQRSWRWLLDSCEFQLLPFAFVFTFALCVLIVSGWFARPPKA